MSGVELLLAFLAGVVKAGDSLSAIASAHGLTLAALLAFPENAKYRAWRARQVLGAR